ncbi:hypothetical protein B7494_g4166 [Chlorociboria aeruginascens]|nr:hypothetical protein B7494_g4166 [Chlorociboria aeruginascens]
MASKMKAIIIPPEFTSTHPSKASNLTLATLPTPTPLPSQVIVRLHSVAISPFELTWPETYSCSRPRVPCHDIAGTIVSTAATPESPSMLAPGDRVFGLLGFSGQGGLAEYTAAYPVHLAKIPEGLSFETAASLPRAFLTSWQAMCVQGGGLVGEGMKVLIVGASGAVGRAGVQIARRRVGTSGYVVAVGGRGSEGLQDLGCDVVHNMREVSGWEIRVQEGGPFDVAFDCVGGKMLESCLRLVKDQGQVITVGTPTPVLENVDGFKEAQERGVRCLFFIVDGSAKELTEIVALVERGDLKPSVTSVVDGLTEPEVEIGILSNILGVAKLLYFPNLYSSPSSVQMNRSNGFSPFADHWARVAKLSRDVEIHSESQLQGHRINQRFYIDLIVSRRARNGAFPHLATDPGVLRETWFFFLARSPDLDPGYGTMESIETIWVTLTETVAGDSMCCISGASTASIDTSTPTSSPTSLVAFGTITAPGGKGSIIVPSSALPSSSGTLSLASTDSSSTTRGTSIESSASDIESIGTVTSSSIISSAISSSVTGQSYHASVSGDIMTSPNSVASSSIISTTDTCSDDSTANPSGVSSAGDTGHLTTSSTVAPGQTEDSYRYSSLSDTVDYHKETKVMADIQRSMSSGGSEIPNPGGVPRLMVYVQTFHDVLGAPLSLLPLLNQETNITHIIIAALHLMGPNNIHLNDNPPDDPMYDQLWNETKILQQNGVKVLAMMGGAAIGSYIALSGTDELFNANYQPLRDNFIKKYNLDGLDLDIEEEVDISVPRRLLEALRTDMGDSFLRTMAPVASALKSKPNPQGGLSGFSYFDLDANTDSLGIPLPDPSGANLVSWYNVQFYSGFGDPSTPATYKSIIDQGWDPSRIVLGVLDSRNDGGGFVSIDKLVATIKSLRTMYTNFGGVIGWEYFDAGANDTSVDPAIKANEPWSWVKEIGNALFDMLSRAKRALTSNDTYVPYFGHWMRFIRLKGGVRAQFAEMQDKAIDVIDVSVFNIVVNDGKAKSAPQSPDRKLTNMLTHHAVMRSIFFRCGGNQPKEWHCIFRPLPAVAKFLVRKFSISPISSILSKVLNNVLTKVTSQIQCDEVHPACLNCIKHNSICDFMATEPNNPPFPLIPVGIPRRGTSRTAKTSRETSPKQKVPSWSTAGNTPSPKPMAIDVPDDDALKQRLIHYYISISSKRLARLDPEGQSAKLVRAWTDWMMSLAPNKPILMDALLGWSAFHWRCYNRDDQELFIASQKYMTRAIVEHRRQVCEGISQENAEELLATNFLISVYSISSREFATTEANTVPLHWFRTYQGMGGLVMTAAQYVRNEIVRNDLQAQQASFEIFLSYRERDSLRAFSFLIDDLHPEDVNPQTMEVYKFSVDYLSFVLEDPSIESVFKFPTLVSRRFLELLEGADPTILTIIGYFFLLAKRSRDIDTLWLVDGMIEKEFDSLMALLPYEYWPRMEWAMQEFAGTHSTSTMYQQKLYSENIVSPDAILRSQPEGEPLWGF